MRQRNDSNMRPGEDNPLRCTLGRNEDYRLSIRQPRTPKNLNEIKTKILGQFNFRTSVCPKFHMPTTYESTQILGEKYQNNFLYVKVFSPGQGTSVESVILEILHSVLSET